MRTALVVVLVTVAGAGSLEALQDPDAKRPPLKRGDEIVAEGCLNGTMLESVDAAPAHDNTFLPTGLNFQLKGKKDVIKELVSKHDGHLVEITGVLKSNIQTAASRGGTIGKTRIVIGVRSTTPDRAMMPAAEDPLPVLDVKSFESANVNCRR